MHKIILTVSKYTLAHKNTLTSIDSHAHQLPQNEYHKAEYLVLDLSTYISQPTQK